MVGAGMAPSMPTHARRSGTATDPCVSTSASRLTFIGDRGRLGHRAGPDKGRLSLGCEEGAGDGKTGTDVARQRELTVKLNA
jgi:hypothetical protein